MSSRIVGKGSRGINAADRRNGHNEEHESSAAHHGDLGACGRDAGIGVNAGGILTGATGVMVGGDSYDVRFATGTCTQVFGTCQQSSFTFQTRADALAAAQALDTQVLLDTAAGSFDTQVRNTAGCSMASMYCSVYVPFSVVGTSVNLAVFLNAPFAAADSISGDYVRTVNEDYGSRGNDTLAVFTLSPAVTAGVPEPATWATMMLGFGGLGYTLRRKNKGGARIRFA